MIGPFVRTSSKRMTSSRTLTSSRWFLTLLLVIFLSYSGSCCEWGIGEDVRKFVRVHEDASPGTTVLTINVTQPDLLTIQSTSEEADGLFRIETDRETEEEEGREGRKAITDERTEGRARERGKRKTGDKWKLGKIVVAAPLQPLLQALSPVVKLGITCGNNQVSVQVTVYVEDVNDHAPVFLVKNITVTVDELTPVGLTILPEIRVRDDDKANTANSEVELLLITGNHDQHFTMADRKRGTITLAKTLDYDAGPKTFQLGVMAKDMGSPALSSTTTITVVVVDADDLPPVFSHNRYSAKISENPGPDLGMSIRQEVSVTPGGISALDGDKGQNASLRYSLVDSPAAHYFTLQPNSGRLYLTRHLDRENITDSTLVLHIRAEQVDNPRRVASSIVEIEVEDLNDNLPRFTHDVYAISIVENLPSGFSVVQVSASDPDEGLNGAFNYHVTGGNGALTVNPLSGWLTVANHNILDREESPIITLHVCANQITPLVTFPGSRSYSSSTTPGSTEQVFNTDPNTRTIRKRVLKSVRPIESEETVLDTTEPSVLEDTTVGISEIPESTSAAPLLRRVVRVSKRPVRPVRSVLKTESQSANAYEEDLYTESATNRNLRSSHNTMMSVELSVMPSDLEDEEGSATTEMDVENQIHPLERVRRVWNDPQPYDILPAHLPAHPFRTRRENRPSRIVLKRRRKSQTLDMSELEQINGTHSEGQTHDESESLSCARIELKLLDANDNNPVFLPANQYEFTVTEEIQEGDLIGKVHAVDIDEAGNGQVSYKLQSRGNNVQDTIRGAIGIDNVTGNVTLMSKFPKGHFTFFVEASDTPLNPSETRTSLAVVTIKVETSSAGEVSNEPRFVGAPYELWVGGDAPVGTSIGQVRVMDMTGPNIVFDMFHSYEDGVPFAIEESSGIVSVMKPLQDFSIPTYDFEAVVTDGQTSMVTNLTVHIAPSVTKPVTSRRDTIIYFNVQENLSGGFVGDVMLALRNMGVRIAPDPQFELVSPETRKYFALAQDATLYTVAPLDYETHPNHTLVIVSARTSDIFYVNVQVEDVNDNPPQLNAVSYEGLLRENAFPGTVVRLLPTIQVSDGDKYLGATYTLHLSGSDATLFSIESSDGIIKFVGESLDREVKDSYNLQLEARDDGNLSSKANLTITVEDVNDNPPKFVKREPLFSSRIGEENSSRKLPDSSNLEFIADLERNLVRIPESLPIGSQVTKVTATDEDEALFADIRYDVESQRSFEFASMEHKSPPLFQEDKKFSIESKTGIVIVIGVLEPDHFYILNISATDGGGLASYTTVAIAVFDVNDHTPRFERPVYNFEVAEGEYLVGEVGKVGAYDQDLGKNAEIRYQIIFLKNSSLNEVFPFRIVETSGTILATGAVDRETKDSYEFSVVATDLGEPPLSSSVLVHIDVTDVNDHAPIFYGYQDTVRLPYTIGKADMYPEGNFTPIYKAVVSENAPENTPVASIYANDSDSSHSGNGIILYTLEGGGDKFAIDSKNGSVYTVGPLDYERWPLHNLTVVAHDLGSPPLKATAILSITVSDVDEELTSRLFDREEYQVIVEENNNTPLHLLDLNISSTYASHKLTYQLVDLDLAGLVAVDSMSGQVYLTASLDRETKDFYRFKVKAIHPERGRSMDFPPTLKNGDHPNFLEYAFSKTPTLVPYAAAVPLDITDLLQNDTTSPESPKDFLRVPAEVIPLVSSGGTRRGRRTLWNGTLPREQNQDDPGKLESSSRVPEKQQVILAMDEVWIAIKVLDQNDNSPKFVPLGRPIVAGVPSSAAYGHFVTRITATDPDQGINGEIKYEILPSEGSLDATKRFAVDPTSGQVVVVGSLTEESGRMFGFDVRATDQKGASTGRTAIANVFVHVLGPDRHLVVEVGATPRDVEPHLHHLQGMLTNVSGLDVRIQRIAPHVDGDAAHTTATDLYVYAVDPLSQAVVEAAQLRHALTTRKGLLKKLLPAGLHYRGMRYPVPPRQGHVLQTAELAILIGAVVVFLATVTTVVCLCYKQRKGRRKPAPMQPIMTAGGIPVMPLAYPGPFGAPYMHMSDHSSADSSEAQELPHETALYHHEVPQYPIPATHYPKAPPRRRSCAHNYKGEHELLHSCNSERVSSQTDEDDAGGGCQRHAASKKRRRGGPGYQSSGESVTGSGSGGGGGAAASRTHGHDRGPSRVPSRTPSRVRQHQFQDEHSSSDLDERDHLPPQVNIPRPQRCCAEDRQRVNPNQPRTGLTTIDCNLENPTRAHSPDSLERPHSRLQHSHHHQHHQGHERSQTLKRTSTQRDRGITDDLRRIHKSSLLPSDITEL